MQDSEVPPIDVPPYNDVTAFVLSQWQRMPPFWAWPVRIATTAFAIRPFFTHGAPFHRLDPHRRGLLIESWRLSSIGPCRDLIRFYRSLALMALYTRGGPPR
jgi:hypothetical protein